MKQLTHKKVASSTITFDGKSYTLSVRRNMSGDGLRHFRATHEDEIQTAKALCFANHIAQYGYSNQLTPDNEIEIVEDEVEEIVEVVTSDEVISEKDRMIQEIYEANKTI